MRFFSFAKTRAYFSKSCVLILALLLSGCDNEQLLKLAQLADFVFDNEALPLVHEQRVTDPDIPDISVTKQGRHRIIYPRERWIYDDSFPDDTDGDPFMYERQDWLHKGAQRRFAREDARYDVGIPDFVKSDGERLYVNSLVRGLTMFDLNPDGSMRPIGEHRKDWGDGTTILAEDGFCLVIETMDSLWFIGSKPETYPPTRPRSSAIRLLDGRSESALGEIPEVRRWELQGRIVSARRVGKRLYVVTYDGRVCDDCKSSPDGVEIHVFDASSLRALKKLATVPFVPDQRRSHFGGVAKISQHRILISRVSFEDDSPEAEPRNELWSYALSDDPSERSLSGPMVTSRSARRSWQVDEQGDDVRVVTTARYRREPTIEVFSLAKEQSPQFLGKVTLNQVLEYKMHNVVFDSDRVYLSTDDRGLQIVELAPAKPPRLAAKLSAREHGDIVVPDGHRLVVLGNADPAFEGQATATLWDVSSPDFPEMLSRIDVPWTGEMLLWNEGLHEDKLLRYTVGDAGLWFPLAREFQVIPGASLGADGAELKCIDETSMSAMAHLDWSQDQLKLGGEVRFWGEERFALLDDDELITVGLLGAMRHRVDLPNEPRLTASQSLYLRSRDLTSASRVPGSLFRLSESALRNHVKVQMISREMLGSLNYQHEIEVALDDSSKGCPRDSMLAELFVSGNRVHVLTWQPSDGKGAAIITLDFDESTGLRFVGRTNFDLRELYHDLEPALGRTRLEQSHVVQKGRFLFMVNRLDQKEGGTEVVVIDLDASSPRIVERYLRPSSPYYGGLFESGAHEVTSYYAELDPAHPGELSFVWQRMRVEQDGRLSAISTRVPGLPLAQSQDGLTGTVLGFSKSQMPESDPVKCFEQPYIFYYNETTQSCHRLVPQLHHVALLGQESLLLSTQPLERAGFRLFYLHRAGPRVLLTHLPHEPHYFDPVQLGEDEAPAEAFVRRKPTQTSPTTILDGAPGRRHQLFSITDDFKVVSTDLDPFLDPEQDTRLRFEGPDQILRHVGWHDGDLLEISGEQKVRTSRRFERVGERCFPLALVGGSSLWCRGYWEGIYPYESVDLRSPSNPGDDP